MAVSAISVVLRLREVINWAGKKGMESEKKVAAWQRSKFTISVETGMAALNGSLRSHGNRLGVGDGGQDQNQGGGTDRW